MATDGQHSPVAQADSRRRRDKLLQIIFNAVDDALLGKILNDGFDSLSRDSSREACELKEWIRRAYPQAHGIRPFQNKTGAKFFSNQVKRIIRKDVSLQGVALSYWARDRQAWLNTLKERASAAVLSESQLDLSLLEQNPDQIFELSEELSALCQEKAIPPREMAILIKWQTQQPNEDFFGNNPEQYAERIEEVGAEPPQDILPTQNEALRLLDEAWDHISRAPIDATDWDQVIAKLATLLEAARENQQTRRSLNLLNTRLAQLKEKWQPELDYFEIAYTDWEITSPAQLEANDITATLEDLDSVLAGVRQLRSRKAGTRSQDKEISQQMDALETRLRALTGKLSASFLPQKIQILGNATPREADSSADASNEREQTSESAEEADEEDYHSLCDTGQTINPLSAPLGETDAASVIAPEATVLFLPQQLLGVGAVIGDHANEDSECAGGPVPTISSQPEPLLSVVEAAQQALNNPQDSSWRALLYALIASDNLPLAYWLAHSSSEIGRGSNGESIINANVIAALIGARQAVSPSENLAAELFGFLTNCPYCSGQAAELFLLATSITPMLTMPQSTNGVVQEFLLEADVCKPFRRLVHLLSEFRRQHPYQPVSASVLSALNVEESLQERIRNVVRQTTILIDEGPGYQFSFGGSGRVWRRLLSEQCEIGQALRLVAEDARAKVAEVAAIARRWEDEDFVAEQIHRINQESHHQRHPGEIVGASFRQLRERLEEAVALLRGWVALIYERQGSSGLLNDRLRDDLRRLRDSLMEVLPQCQNASEELFAESLGVDAATAAAARALSQALSDVNGLLKNEDQQTQFVANGSLRRTLNQALWRIPELEMLADGSPHPSHLPNISRLVAQSIVAPRHTEPVIKLWLERGRYDLAAHLLEQVGGKEQVTNETRLAVAEEQRRAASAISARIHRLQEKFDDLRLGYPPAEERLEILTEELASIAAERVEYFQPSLQRIERIEAEFQTIEADCVERLRRESTLCQPKEPQDAVEADLAPLIEKLNEAVSQRRTILCLSLWRPLRFFGLLPFHLHLKWPDLIESLPLNANFTLLPFTSRDELLARRNLYEVASAERARRDARTKRIQSQRHNQNDGKACDWELGLTQEKSKKLPPRLPGPSFLAIDRVTIKGSLRRGTRPVLGRIARRDAYRPHFLTLSSGSGELSNEAAQMLRQTDIMLVSLQGVRGRKSVANLQRILEHGSARQPTLILASSPIELLALTGQCGLLGERHLIREPEWWPRSLEVRKVGCDRAQSEKQFEQAFASLRGISAELDHIIELAYHAWWELRQDVVTRIAAEPAGEYARFLNALDRLRSFAPHDARMLEQGKEFLERQRANSTTTQERYDIIARLVNEAPAGSTVTILTRDQTSASALQEQLSAELGFTAEELSRQGINIQVCRLPDAAPPVDRLIVAGYFGLRTIDAVQAYQANQIYFIFDPIEVLVAWYGVGRMKQALEPFNTQWAMRSLTQITDCLYEHLPCRVEEIEFAFPWLSSGEPSVSRGSPAGLHKDEAIIVLNDGTRLSVSRHSRFDVLTQENAPPHVRHRAALKRVTAARLQCGDEIILLHDDLQASFSTRMLKAIDAGYLKNLAEARQSWATLVKAMTMSEEISAKKIKEQMAALGEDVDESTIRAWLKINEDFSLDDEATIPESFSRFAAFARVIGLALAEERLRDRYEKIHRLRVEHRRAGRRLVAAVKNVYLNGYDAASLAKIEHYYGLDVRELVQGARPATVDEVILAEGESHEIEQ